MLESRLAEIPEWQEQRYDFPRYVGHFLLSLLMFWPPLVPRTSTAIQLLLTPLICLSMMVAGSLVSLRALRSREPHPVELFVLCGMLAIGVVMAIHLGFTFQRHFETGWLKGVYPRYYLALLPALPAACAVLVSRSRTPALAALLMALSVGYAGAAGMAVARTLP
jgi:hypothetical protein